MEVDSLALGGATGYSQRTASEQTPRQTNGNVGQAASNDAPVATEKAQPQQPLTQRPERDGDKGAGKELRITEEDIQKTIQSANKRIEPTFLEFHYKIHEKTNQLMISVVNISTKEVVREIPPERALDALAKMWELSGILLDKKG